MFFESIHSFDENEFRLSTGNNMTFPLHLHRSFEFIALLEGKTDVTVDQKVYRISAGQAVLIFPYQMHAYRTIGETVHRMCIFSPDLVPDFHKKCEYMLPRDNLMTHIVSDAETDNLFLQRAYAYAICGAFDRQREYDVRRKTLDNEILHSLLLYADSHFRTECLLRNAAAALGYDYAYLSKYFKQKVGMSFRRYVNLLRIRESQHLLRSGTESITQIGELCGFQNLRTFDRDFFELTGVAPSDYRKRYTESKV